MHHVTSHASCGRQNQQKVNQKCRMILAIYYGGWCRALPPVEVRLAIGNVKISEMLLLLRM